MSLRVTLVLGIALILTTSLVCGGALVYWHAVNKVDTEMSAALAVGDQTVRNAVSDIERAAPPSQDVASLVKSLDGDRHLRATLMAPHGAVLSRSTPLQSDDPAPEWFYRMLVHEPGVSRVPVRIGPDRFGVILLETDSRNEIGEAWSDAVLTLTILVLFCFLSALLVYWVVGRSLKPLNAIVQAFQRVGSGDYAPQAPEGGPRELAQLSRGFNQMVTRLAQMSQRKDRLEEQLVEVQEEERAELARDLHDEIGPLLFAVSVDLVALREHDALRGDSQLRARLAATDEAVSRMQQHVRSILGRLRPPTVADLGLRHSVEGLTTFWRTRYPAVSFHIDIPEEGFSAEIGSGIYRIVQESVSNALRHGHPSRIELSVVRESAESVVVEVCDDGIGLQPDGMQGGLGLTGMRERVNELGGELDVSTGAGGRGVRVRARLPAASEETPMPQTIHRSSV
jgi:two-component system sensor histidine kinase UhpB